jgi:hypothetical protein
MRALGRVPLPEDPRLAVGRGATSAEHERPPTGCMSASKQSRKSRIAGMEMTDGLR